MTAARFCRCARPTRVTDRDGVAHCERCGELLPDAAAVALPLLVRHVAALERKVAELVQEVAK